MRICTCPPRGTSPAHPTGTRRDAKCENKRQGKNKGDQDFTDPPALEGNGKAAQTGCQFWKTEDKAWRGMAQRKGPPARHGGSPCPRIDYECARN